MKKSFGFSIALLVTSFVHSAAWLPGDKWIQQIQTDSKQGSFASVMQRVNSEYNIGEQAGEWSKVLQGEKAAVSQVGLDKVKDKVEKFQAEFDALERETEEALLKISHKYPDTEIARIINDAILPVRARTAQKKMLEELLSMGFTAAQPNLTGFEAQLQQIAIEYRLKKAILYHLATEDRALPDDFEKYAIILDFQLLDAMLESSKKQNETAWTNRLSEAITAYPLIAAANHNRKYLISLSSDISPTQNNAEKETAEVVQKFLNDRRELGRKHFLER